MQDFLIKFFDDDKWSNGPSIELFGLWHILYVVLIIGLTIFVACKTFKKSREVKDKVLGIYAGLILFVYIADFFIMPFYVGGLGSVLDKLPFHICTLMGVLIMLSRYVKVLKPIKKVVAVLSVVSSLMYMTYPGSAIGDISPFVYKVIQTFVFHGLVFGYGVLSITTGDVKLGFKKIYEEAIALVFIMCWANFGNTAYRALESTGGSTYDWFFITGSTFPFIPAKVMPLVVIICIFAMCAIIQFIFRIMYKQLEKKNLTSYLNN